jgi:hypothetical protein
VAITLSLEMLIVAAMLVSMGFALGKMLGWGGRARSRWP